MHGKGHNESHISTTTCPMYSLREFKKHLFKLIPMSKERKKEIERIANEIASARPNDHASQQDKKRKGFKESRAQTVERLMNDRISIK